MQSGELNTNFGVDLDEISAAERECVLIVDDDPDNVYLLKQILLAAGYNVLSASNGEEAIKKFTAHKPDLIMLDLLMPSMDGHETLKYIRQISNVPIIYVSALSDKEDIVKSLLEGVDDYITKPFFNAEVIARIKAVLRRSGEPKNIRRKVFPQVGLIIDSATQEIILEENRIQLTHKEFAILNILAQHAPDVVNYQTITQSVWGEDTDDARKRTKYLVYLLRRKLDGIQPGTNLITNVERLGYKLQTE